MTLDPIVVAPYYAMAGLWVDANRERFTRRPRIVVGDVQLRGLSDVHIVLVQVAARPLQPGVYVETAVQAQLSYLEAFGSRIERIYLP